MKLMSSLMKLSYFLIVVHETWNNAEKTVGVLMSAAKPSYVTLIAKCKYYVYINYCTI